MCRYCFHELPKWITQKFYSFPPPIAGTRLRPTLGTHSQWNHTSSAEKSLNRTADRRRQSHLPPLPVARVPGPVSQVMGKNILVNSQVSLNYVVIIR